MVLLSLALLGAGGADRDSKKRQKLSLLSELQLSDSNLAVTEGAGSDHRATGRSRTWASHGNRARTARQAQWEMHHAASEKEEGEEQQRESSSGLWSLFWPLGASTGGGSKSSEVQAKAASTDFAAEAGEPKKEPQAPKHVVIKGATGPVAEVVNGEYLAAPAKYNEKVLYQSKENPGVWLRYVTAGGLKQWRVSTSQSLNANNDKGYVYCEEPGLNDPTLAKKWYVWMGTRWSLEKTVSVTTYVMPKPAAPKVEPGFFASCKRWIYNHRYASVVLLVLAWGGGLGYAWYSWKQAFKK